MKKKVQPQTIGKYRMEEDARKYARKHETRYHNGRITCAIDPRSKDFDVYCWECKAK